MKRAIVGLAGGTLVLLLGLGIWVWTRARASLPREGGEVSLAGLDGPVTIHRDELGIPVIVATSLEDAVRAHGFVHAQDRFFQMDLARRATAGELAGLVGARAVEADAEKRRLQRRRAARQLLADLDAADRRLIEAYCEGVNAGLADLGGPPPEYLLLRGEPEPWRPEDSLVLTLSFFDLLSFNHRMERQLAVMEATLPAELVEFLTPSTSRWDVPLVSAEKGGYTPAAVPGPEILDLRSAQPPEIDRDVVRPTGIALGSNNWAVAAQRSTHGGAILANDPHLGLRVPHVWHRVEFEIADRRVAGVGSPGLPGVVIGSNGGVAWGATNSFADQTDIVIIEVDDADPSRYRTPQGWEPFRVHVEEIEVAGGEPASTEIAWTRWGPVTDEDWRGRPLVVHSPVHQPHGLDFDLMRMMQAHTLETAMDVVAGWRGPSQNWMLAAADGRIAWVVNGPIPARRGLSGKYPRSWSDPAIGWDGERPGPRVESPAAGRLYTANGRTVPHSDPPLTHVWMHSARSHRIRQRLDGRPQWDEAGLRGIQLDTRSAYNDFVVDLVQEIVPGDEADVELAGLWEAVLGWDGTAEIDQSGFVAVGALAEALLDAILTPLLAPAAAVDEEFVYNWALGDEPMRRILEERPPHLVPPGHDDWRGFLRSLMSEVAGELAAAPGGFDRTWGEARPVAIRHPLGGLALLGRYLNMPAGPLPGWAGTVRAQTASYGASMRMVVSPGRAEMGLLHMPTGQSGHFMSPHYADSHEAWVTGAPTPFLAGEPVSTLTLTPR